MVSRLSDMEATFCGGGLNLEFSSSSRKAVALSKQELVYKANYSFEIYRTMKSNLHFENFKPA